MFNKRLYAILLVLVGIFFFAGCSSTTSDTTTDDTTDSLADELVGTWENTTEIGPVTTDSGETVSGSVKFTYVFNDDKTCTLDTREELVTGENPADVYDYTTDGTWDLSDDELTITMTKEEATNEQNADTEEESGKDTLAMETLTKEAQLNDPGVPTIHKITIDGDELTMTNEQGDFTFTRVK